MEPENSEYEWAAFSPCDMCGEPTEDLEFMEGVPLCAGCREIVETEIKAAESE